MEGSSRVEIFMRLSSEAGKIAATSKIYDGT